jgi:hypothetical protein
MAGNRRVDLRKILADPELRRKLMVSTIQATQAREGIDTTEEQAQRAYYVVNEAEKATFVDLTKFRRLADNADLRQQMFVRTLRGETTGVRFDIPRRDFGTIEGAPLSYRRLVIMAALFRGNPRLSPAYADIKIGHQTFDDDRFVRFWWEIPTEARGPRNVWVPFAKGGDFSRFYADVYLLVRWDDDAPAVYATRTSNFSVLLTTNSAQYLYRPGLTWPLAASVFNVRILPPGCIFAHKGPAIFPIDDSKSFFLATILNSELALFTLKGLTSREEMGGRWEAGVVKRLPIVSPNSDQQRRLSELGKAIFDAKCKWDASNEISSSFDRPWLVGRDEPSPSNGIASRLASLLTSEERETALAQDHENSLNEQVYTLYGISSQTRVAIRENLGQMPAEVIWPQMEGKTHDQKRMEHVWRLLSYAMKRVVESDEHGVVPFMHLSGEVPVLDRVHIELGKLFPGRDANEVEVEIVNELKHKVKGYVRVESIREWLENVYFEYHVSLYRKRPIFWHISSKQGKGPAAFSAMVHYHRFDKDRMAKLRGIYLREALALFRREAALASQARRADDRLEWQTKVEEAEELDLLLQRVQEGFHRGAEDFRILTPWKAEDQRPKGWDPDINDGVKVNIEPLQRAGVLRIPEVV